MTSTRPACWRRRESPDHVVDSLRCSSRSGLQVGLVNLLDCVASPTQGTTRTSGQLTCFSAPYSFQHHDAPYDFHSLRPRLPRSRS